MPINQFYSKRHYERLSNGGPDTPERIAERRREYAIREQVQREGEEKFPELTTADQFREFVRWQDERLGELLFEKQK